MVDQGQDVKRPPRTSVELFAGGGGLAMGVHNAGFRPLLFNEFNARACETLIKSAQETLGDDGLIETQEVAPKPPGEGQPAPLYPGDVTRLNLTAFQGQVDVLAGGPPCQPFSAGGVAKGDEDKRNMFPAMFKAVRQMRPKAVICENVRGLLRPSFADYFDYILKELQFPFLERDDKTPWQEHYKYLKGQKTADSADQYKVLMVPVNAADYGVPQVRNRVVIVAFRGDLGIDMEAFEKEVKTKRYSEAALHYSMRKSGSYWKRHDDVPSHVREKVQARLPKDLGEVDSLPWRTLRDAITGHGIENKKLKRLPNVDLERLHEKHNFGERDGINDHVGWPGARIYKGHTPNELDRPAKTVKAGVHGVPGGESVMLVDDLAEDGFTYRHRYMTVRETARVMTFPDEWSGSGPRGEQMRQLGNAVPVVLGEFFAKAVSNALDTVSPTSKASETTSD